MGSIGQLLRDRRDALGLRPEKVAEQAHVPENLLVAFEAGKGNITASALDRVAAVLAIDPFALRERRLVPRPTATVLFQQFRAFADFRDDEDAPKVATALERATYLLEVNAILGRQPSLRARLEPTPPPPVEAAKDGYRLAAHVRKVLGNEVDPLADVARILEEDCDIFVSTEHLASSRIDALSAKDNESGAATVVLNRSSERRMSTSAARVALAHELSHVLFDPANGRVNLVIDEDERHHRSVTLAEQRARAFAAELLMPAEGLRRILGRPQYTMSKGEAMPLVDRVRREFVTPIEIAVSHLVDREYVWSEIREELIEEMHQREASVVPAPHLPSNWDLLERRVREALDGGLVTQGRAREILGLSPWDDLPTSA